MKVPDTKKIQTSVQSLSLDGFWPMLALDHGLTVGHDESVPMSLVPELLEGAAESLGSVVMTYGLAKFTVPKSVTLPLVIQCFGAPGNHPKFQVCSVEQALEVGAKGIAVQVDFNLSRKKLNRLLRDVTKLTYHAHSKQLSVLFMVIPEMNKYTSLSQTIRFCVELGADLIKVRCNPLKLDGEEKRNLKSIFKDYPPVLLAGGGINNNILQQIGEARDIGFSGYCIGRNIFQSENPIEMAHNLRNAWNS